MQEETINYICSTLYFAFYIIIYVKYEKQYFFLFLKIKV